ncbi:hypothetical protein POM88_009223 [Heracleum sosnowskyi]|uniref:Uncharacterized protein n=1 Tax=Heracleum sosnowskyi TaxID=360622 RepID=A0AAD8N2H9_9APIA|nr:hypothetical protein POM88_009223 [Heracleum sosnowskyi]
MVTLYYNLGGPLLNACGQLQNVKHLSFLFKSHESYFVMSTQGGLGAALVQAIGAHSLLRTSPYCKKIFKRVESISSSVNRYSPWGVEELEEEYGGINHATLDYSIDGLMHLLRGLSGYAMDTENPHEQVHSSSLESRTDLTHLRGDNDPDKIVDELKEESAQLFDTLDESHLVHEVNVNNMAIEEKNRDENVKDSLMDSDNPHKQLELGVVEEYRYSNVESDVSATVDSPAGDSYLLEHMTCSQVFNVVTLDINDPKEYADTVKPSIVDFQESKAEILTGDLEDVATGKETTSFTKAPSVRVSDSVSDDKETIDRSEMRRLVM